MTKANKTQKEPQENPEKDQPDTEQEPTGVPEADPSKAPVAPTPPPLQDKAVTVGDLRASEEALVASLTAELDELRTRIAEAVEGMELHAPRKAGSTLLQRILTAEQLEAGARMAAGARQQRLAQIAARSAQRGAPAQE